MDYGIRSRLEASTIVGSMEPREPSGAGISMLIGLSPVILAFIAAIGLRFPALVAIAVSVPVGIFLWIKIDAHKLRWLAREFDDAERHSGFELTKSLESVLIMRPVSADVIQAGWYVISQDECREVQEKNQKIKDSYRTESITSSLDGMPLDDSHPTAVLRTTDPAQQQRDIDADLQKMVRFRLVVAVRRFQNYGWVILGFAGKQGPEEIISFSDKFYLLKVSAPSHIAAIIEDSTSALNDLMLAAKDLPREDLLVARLLRNYSEVAVQHAIDAALATGLLRRSRPRDGDHESRVTEFFDIFRSGSPANGGHRSCRLQVTQLGEMWLDLGPELVTDRDRSATLAPESPEGILNLMAEHTARPGGFEYDIALSFAGEQRAYVSKVAATLDEMGIRVFYDDYEQASLWGKDLFEHLDWVYQKAAKYCVLFASADYARKVWTTHERRSAQARALHSAEEYVLPARFDDTEIPGLRPTVAYVDLRAISPAQLAKLISEKIGR